MLNIFLSTDEHNIVGLLTTINSIIKNTVHIQKIKFYILSYNEEEEQLLTTHINKNFNINYKIDNFKKYEIYDKFLNENMKVNGGKFEYIKNIMNFARFYLPIIFNEVDIALYLDTDVIVNVDIFNITKHVFNLNFVMATSLNRKLEHMNFNNKLKIDNNKMGFNTGVYLYNCKYWRNNKFTEKCEQIMMEHKEKSLFSLGTQPIMNLLYYDLNIINLDCRWNVTGLGTFKIAKVKAQNAFILHWTGKLKPWLENGLNKHIWEKYKINI